MSDRFRPPRGVFPALLLLALPLLSGGAVGRVPRPVAVVEIHGIQFQPDTLRIRAGQTVEWRNRSKLTHTVTADPEKAADPADVRLPEGAKTFDSGALPPGDTYRRTFEVPGTYGYFCVPHEAAGMTGTIVVEPARGS